MKPPLIFDLDGTLIDSAPDIANAVNQTLHKYSKQTVEYATVVSHIGEGLKKLLVGFFPEYHNDPQMMHNLELEFLEIYETQMLHLTKIFPGVMEFLKSWGGPLGIVTNKNIAPTRVLIKHLGLDAIPWIEVFGADSLREKKPSALPLRTMMKLANREAHQTLMIGDGIPDMLSAQNAGVKSIAINFGYTHGEILAVHRPAAELNHYSDLNEVIRQLGF